MKRKKEPKVHKTTPAEIANDPSLRWHAYQKGELLLSDQLNKRVRFLRYEGDKIRVADHVLRELPDNLDMLKVRREVFLPYKDEESREELRQAMVAMNAMKRMAQMRRQEA